MPRVALAFAYDGSRFASYARQPGRRTVEGELLAALRSVDLVGSAGPARFVSGSRTDRGVSAAFNVCAFDTDAAPAAVAGAPRTPQGLWFLSARSVPDAFNPRHARRRRYRYLLPRRPGVDADALRKALGVFVGRHDFSAFSRPEPRRDPVRRIDRVGVRPGRDALEVTIDAPSFLWQQVRRLVAAAGGAAEGRWSVASLRAALRDPASAPAFGVAPPEGLFLERVDYGMAFPPGPSATARRLGRDALRAQVRRAVLQKALRTLRPRNTYG